MIMHILHAYKSITLTHAKIQSLIRYIASTEQSQSGHDVSAGQHSATVATEERHSLLEGPGQSPGTSGAG